MPKGNKTEKTGFIDWDELDGKLSIDINAEDDSFERNPPPQPGYYKVKVGWQDKEEGVIEKVRDEQDKLQGYKLYANVTILQGDEKGVVIPVWISTVQNKNKRTSQLASLLNRLGHHVEGKQTHKALVLKFRKLVNAGLICWVKVRWRGSVQVNGEWVNVINNESGFDKKDDGTYSSTKERKVKGEWMQIEAQAGVDKWFKENPDIGVDDENDDEDEDEKPVVKKPKKPTRVVDDEDEDEDEVEEDEDSEDEDEEEEEEVPVTVVKKTKKIKKPKPVVDEDDEDED